ncbi:hypothetical protein BU16DRAFT_554833 [Lophium mytilinum]|uniref:Uncharacterized protein n=1 Tax=Lophium mytilinum TaxID=390894 RepID=A0A6A6RDN3_9PEZI|nr:hypothetical protein BU16DRAFT_554833 [Lophium mytilinum]
MELGIASRWVHGRGVEGVVGGTSVGCSFESGHVSLHLPPYPTTFCTRPNAASSSGRWPCGPVCGTAAAQTGSKRGRPPRTHPAPYLVGRLSGPWPGLGLLMQVPVAKAKSNASTVAWMASRRRGEDSQPPARAAMSADSVQPTTTMPGRLRYGCAMAAVRRVRQCPQSARKVPALQSEEESCDL